MSTVLLNLTDISYTYFTHPILSGLNWEIQAGQKIGLIGANGGGKSTLLKLILGQLAPEAGSIFRVKDLTIGYLPQDARTDTYDAEPDLGPLHRPQIGTDPPAPSWRLPCPARPRSPGCAAPWPRPRPRWAIRPSTASRRAWRG